MSNARKTRSPFFKGPATADSDSEAPSTSTSETASPDLRRRKVGDTRKNATWRIQRDLLEDFIQWCEARDYAQNLTIEEFIRRGMREVE
jgi:hypothetical protein